MRLVKILGVIAVCLVGLSLVAGAAQNKFGVADSRRVTFQNPIWVGDVLLPKGDYQVLHTMEGDNHIMVFKQIVDKKPVEVHVKCQLVKLTAKASTNQQIYTYDAKNVRILKTLIFKGDTAQHNF